MKIVFVADADLAYEGFLINYEATNASTGNKTAFVYSFTFTTLQNSTMRILCSQTHGTQWELYLEQSVVTSVSSLLKENND